MGPSLFDDLRVRIAEYEELAASARGTAEALKLELAERVATADGVTVGTQYETAQGVLMEVVGIAVYPRSGTAYMAKVVKVKKDGRPHNVAASTEYRANLLELIETYRLKQNDCYPGVESHD